MANLSGLSAENVSGLRALPMGDAIRFWDAMEAAGRRDKNLEGVVRSLVLADLFYLLVRVCRREDMMHPWVYARVREVEANPDNMLDLWARGHFKSSTITFGKTIQDILADPEITFGIFSHTRPIAKAFLRQIMREFEANTVLQTVFPDVLWGKDTRAAPKWSEDDGIIVRRKSNPPEATVEAWGLVDGQPTSKHFKVLLYDDIVVEGSVTTPEMIDKTLKALEQSYNLASEAFVRRFIGTRWHFADAYRTVRDRGTAKPREHPGTRDGTEDGEPVFWSLDMLRQKRRDMGPYTFAAQILLDPKADSLKGFRREWLRHHDGIGRDAAQRMTRYLLVDAANSRRKGSDYTAMWVVGLGLDRNYYVLDIVRDRLSLSERCARLMALHRKWQPRQVRYEKYGMMADVEHIATVQKAENYRFDVTEVAGLTSKTDRIGRLMPLFEQGRIYLPRSLHATDYEKTVRDLVYDFIEYEYAPFPVGSHEDMLDALARIAEPDLPLVWPKEEATGLDSWGRPRSIVVDGAESSYWGLDAA
jgi:predicted phage terminase large subunit-like protein